MRPTDRWNVICGTEYGLRTRPVDVIDGPTIAVEGGIYWGAKHRVDAWATMRRANLIASFPAGVEAWAHESTRYVWAKAGVPFSALYDGEKPTIMGPQGVPRPANALFLALEKIIEELGGKEIRIHGARWHNRARRWQRWVLRRYYQRATDRGIDIRIMPTYHLPSAPRR